MVRVILLREKKMRRLSDRFYFLRENLRLKDGYAFDKLRSERFFRLGNRNLLVGLDCHNSRDICLISHKLTELKEDALTSIPDIICEIRHDEVRRFTRRSCHGWALLGK